MLRKRLAAVAVLAAVVACSPGAHPDGFEVPELTPKPRSSVPAKAVPAPTDRPNASDTARLRSWSKRIARVTDIPARAAQAYGLAEMWLASEVPGCTMTWAMIAGIGRTESKHGSSHGARIKKNGQVSPRIIGPVLDGGKGTAHVRDTDDGELDDDKKYDRAVGPLQFIPQTWERLSGRAGNDGKDADPHNIDDAAVTAGRLLCRFGDMSTKKGWWKAVLAYNRSVTYAQAVYSGADAYARASKKAAAKPSTSATARKG